MSEDEIVRDHVHERKLFLQLLWGKKSELLQECELFFQLMWK